MNDTKWFDQLQQRSLFDLYRIYTVIDRELENPHRIAAVKQKLRVGMDLTYFDCTRNCSAKARLVTLRRKTAVVFALEQQKPLLLPYYMLNVDEVETAIHEKTQALTAHHLKIGDRVGFNSEGRDIVGIVQRLNPKTATVHTTLGQKWRVSYSYLYRVHDTEIAMAARALNTMPGAIFIK